MSNVREYRILRLKEELSISIMLDKLWEEIQDGSTNRDEAIQALTEILDDKNRPRYKYMPCRKGLY